MEGDKHYTSRHHHTWIQSSWDRSLLIYPDEIVCKTCFGLGTDRLELLQHLFDIQPLRIFCHYKASGIALAVYQTSASNDKLRVLIGPIPTVTHQFSLVVR